MYILSLNFFPSSTTTTEIPRVVSMDNDHQNTAPEAYQYDAQDRQSESHVSTKRKNGKRKERPFFCN